VESGIATDGGDIYAQVLACARQLTTQHLDQRQHQQGICRKVAHGA